jgi:hypothetical protein
MKACMRLFRAEMTGWVIPSQGIPRLLTKIKGQIPVNVPGLLCVHLRLFSISFPLPFILFPFFLYFSFTISSFLSIFSSVVVFYFILLILCSIFLCVSLMYLFFVFYFLCVIFLLSLSFIL